MPRDTLQTELLAKTGLRPALEAEALRLARGCETTQLLVLRLFASCSATAAELLQGTGQACDTVFASSADTAVLMLPRCSEEHGEELAGMLLTACPVPCAVLVCSVPDLVLAHRGTARGVARGADKVLASLEKALASAQPGPAPVLVRLPGQRREDEARVSVEEKNFLFSCCLRTR